MNLDNLELCSHRYNTSDCYLTRKKPIASNYVGVSWCKQEKKWISRIYFNGKRINLGKFKTEIEASDAYQKKLSEINKNNLKIN